MNTSTQQTVILAIRDANLAAQFEVRIHCIYGKNVRIVNGTSAQEVEDCILLELGQSGCFPAMMIIEPDFPGRRYDNLMQEIARYYPEVRLVAVTEASEAEIQEKLGRKNRLLCRLVPNWDGRTHLDVLSSALLRVAQAPQAVRTSEPLF